MRSPDDARGGPGDPTPRDRPTDDTAAAKRADAATSLAGGSDRRTERRRPPRASASLYAPVLGRSQDALSIRCPRCGGVHMGRVRPGTEAAGKRRTPCGTVIVVVRGRYAPEVTA